DAGGGILSGLSNHDLILRAGSNSEKMRIATRGRGGIGTSNPAKGALYVEANNLGTAIYGSTVGPIGVQGVASLGDGVVGTSGGGNGVFGKSSAGSNKHAGVYGYNHACSFGQAGYGVYSDGNLCVAPGYTKSAVVRTANYGDLKLYSVESPENWFEDFGIGQLERGSAIVRIDPVFVETVNLNESY